MLLVLLATVPTPSPPLLAVLGVVRPVQLLEPLVELLAVLAAQVVALPVELLVPLVGPRARQPALSVVVVARRPLPQARLRARPSQHLPLLNSVAALLPDLHLRAQLVLQALLHLAPLPRVPHHQYPRAHLPHLGRPDRALLGHPEAWEAQAQRVLAALHWALHLAAWARSHQAPPNLRARPRVDRRLLGLLLALAPLLQATALLPWP